MQHVSFTPNAPNHLASDDDGQWEIRDAKGRARLCGHLGAIVQRAIPASQVPVPDDNDGLTCQWADIEDDSDSNVTDVCGTPLSYDPDLCNSNANSMYDARRDPESPEYVNTYPTQWRRVAARERAEPLDVQSRRTGSKWRAAGRMDTLSFFKGPPMPV